MIEYAQIKVEVFIAAMAALLIFVTLNGCTTPQPVPEYVKTVDVSRDQCEKEKTDYFLKTEAKLDNQKMELRECKSKLKKLSDKTGIEP